MAVIYPPEFHRSLWSLRHRSKSDPLEFLEELARSPDDIVAFSLAGRTAFLLKHPDLIEAVLVTHHRKFVKSYGLQRATRLLGHGLLTAEGDRHRRQRAVAQPAFHRQRLEQYAETMVAQAVRVRDSWRRDSLVDVSAEASALTLAIVGRTLFGADVEGSLADVRHAVQLASDAIDPFVSLLAPARRVRPQRVRLAKAIDDLVAHHRSTNGDRENIVALLLKSQEAGPDVITEQLRDDALTILLAGHDTIASALVWTWILLAGQPDAEARLEAEVDAVLKGRLPAAADVPALVFTRRVLAESLRLRPPAWVVARTAVEDCDIPGGHVPAGSIVLISQYLLHRDARFYPNAAAFDPDRWLDERQAGRPKMAYIPFGAGPRACVGEGFAWMEGVLLLATFAQRWRLGLRAADKSIRPDVKITLRPPPVSMTVGARGAPPQTAEPSSPSRYNQPVP